MSITVSHKTQELIDKIENVTNILNNEELNEEDVEENQDLLEMLKKKLIESKKQDEKEHEKNLYENFNFDLNKIKDSAPKRSNSPHHKQEVPVQKVTIVIEENGEIKKDERHIRPSKTGYITDQKRKNGYVTDKRSKISRR